MNIIIAGGRDFTDTTWSLIKLDKILQNLSDITIISGTALGGDKVGETYAQLRGLALKRYPAKWDKHGRAAGHIRNRKMAENADALIAFWDGKSRGTKNMIETARELGLLVRVIRYTV